MVPQRDQDLDNPAADANVLCDLILLYAAQLDGKPARRPPLNAYCSDIIDRLRQQGVMEREKTKRKKKAEDDAYQCTQQQQDDNKRQAMQSEIANHLVEQPDKSSDVWLNDLAYERATGQDTDGALVYPKGLTLQAPAAFYKELFTFFFKRYEPWTAATDRRRNNFSMRFLLSRMDRSANALLEQARIAAGSPRKDSVAWLLTQLNAAIDHHNGLEREKLGDGPDADDRFATEVRITRLRGTEKSIRYEGTYVGFNGAEKRATFLVPGWRVRVASASGAAGDVDCMQHARDEYMAIAAGV